MTITRERKSHDTGWRTRVLVNDPTRGYEIFIEKDVGCGGRTDGTGANNTRPFSACAMKSMVAILF